MWRLCLTSVLWVASSCGGSPEPGRWSGTIREVDGAHVVENPREPLQASRRTAATMAWAIPTPEQESRLGAWEAPTTVRVADTVVYVLDQMGKRIHVVSASDGSWTRSFGSEGSGPGELRGPFGLALTRDAVVVGDGGQASLDFFSPTGEFETSLQFGRLAFAVHALNTEQFLVSALLGSGGGWYVLSAGGEVERFSWPEWLTEVPRVGECSRVFADARGVYRVNCSTLAFQELDQNGRLLREVTVDRPGGTVSEEQVQGHLRHVRAQMTESGLPADLIERQVEREEERLRQIPRIRALRRNPTTGEFAVWEQEPEELGSGPAFLHVFDPDGRYIAPRNFGAPWVDFDWDGIRVYGLERDEGTGLVRLVAWDLE